jgi:hypothetical protein
MSRRADELRQYAVQYRVAAGRGLGITLGAIGIRLGEKVSEWLSLTAPAGDQLPAVLCLYRLDLSGGNDR